MDSLLARRTERYEDFRRFLAGGDAARPYVCLDPSSYASVYAGKDGGHPSVDDQIAFHQSFRNDAVVSIPLNVSEVVPELAWNRQHLKADADGTTYWQEILDVPWGEARRVVADRSGTIPWLVEPAIRTPEDFALVEFHADRIRENAAALARSTGDIPAGLKSLGMMSAAVVHSAFEAYYLIDYPDMPLFYVDWPERYLAAVKKVHAANMAVLEELSRVGVELVLTGSAGMELLSPGILREAIVPFQREFNDHARKLGCMVSYHICGHSRLLIELGIIDAINPTVFETCSGPPCGNNSDLRAAVGGISEEIITKGNLDLGLLRNGTPRQISAAVDEITTATNGRRHIFGQGDATILDGTPHENIQAFLDAAERNQ